MDQQGKEQQTHTAHISDVYTVIMRDGYLEIYENAKGPIEERTEPDVLFTPTEVEALALFLQKFPKSTK